MSPRPSLAPALGWVGPVLAVLAAAIAIYLLVPVLIIVPMSLTKLPFLTWPPELLSLQWFRGFFEDPTWTDPLWRSIRISVPVAVIATAIGTLAAFGVSYARRGRRLLQTLFIAPLVLPIITYALGLHDVSERLGINGSVWPVIIGQTMLAAPLVFVTVSAGLATRDPQLPRAAASLGATGRSVLWRIELPLQRPSIAAGALIALAYSFDEIIIAYFLLPPGGGTLPVQILASTKETGDPTIAAASIVVIGVAATLGAVVATTRALLIRRRTA
jgi:putative spermidine/putrescine transport system permease protein